MNFDNMVKTCGNFKQVKQIKVTSIKKIGFNDMEGNQLQVNVKFLSNDGYRNRLFRVFTNSSVLDWYELETKEEIADFLESCLGSEVQAA